MMISSKVCKNHISTQVVTLDAAQQHCLVAIENDGSNFGHQGIAVLVGLIPNERDQMLRRFGGSAVLLSLHLLRLLPHGERKESSLYMIEFRLCTFEDDTWRFLLYLISLMIREKFHVDFRLQSTLSVA